MVWGFIGFCVGAYISYSFILPDGLLNIKLATLTIGDILRVIGSLALVFLTTGIGGVIGDHFKE
jgi:hypothetical protein